MYLALSLFLLSHKHIMINVKFRYNTLGSALLALQQKLFKDVNLSSGDGGKLLMKIYSCNHMQYLNIWI